MQGQPPSTLMEKDKDGGEVEPRQLTAIFRPDDAGEWKERLRLSHELALGMGGGVGASSWERREDDDVKDEDDVEEDVNDGTIGEGVQDGNKVWRAKRALRKCVCLFFIVVVSVSD
jgi:striatin 1/3/4